VSETLGTALRRAAARLAEAGKDSPELDARLLLAAAAGIDPQAPILEPEQPCEGRAAAALDALLQRRLAGEPLARLLGTREFWSLELEIGPATLVPRPETETVVEAALAALAPSARTRPLRIADLGTGTGAILLALLTELPNAHGVGTDIEPAALAVARRNAARLGLAGRAGFAACDFGAALAGPFDLVAANPPYVASATIATLAPEVCDHEPRRALDGGADGLDAYRALAADLPRLLAPHGVAVLELGAGQEAAVAALLAGGGLRPHLPARTDLAGVPRALVAARL
jgi:release factor glutamine methyltransferase